MTWDMHIDKITTKASQRVTNLNRIKFNLPRPALEKIYLTMIRPVLEYGNIIYTNLPDRLNDKLEAVQRRAALACTGAYRHTSNDKLLHELGWQPLHLRRQTYYVL